MQSRPQLSLTVLAGAIVFLLPHSSSLAASPSNLDHDVREALTSAGFTGAIQSTLEQRLGRPVDRNLANLGSASHIHGVQELGWPHFSVFKLKPNLKL